ncbi:MAG: hypothetical protein IPI60_06125 [Saprospiraceae bacterium]|nr:hypothetical protein [Saprospiraceae bacterium]
MRSCWFRTGLVSGSFDACGGTQTIWTFTDACDGTIPHILRQSQLGLLLQAAFVNAPADVYNDMRRSRSIYCYVNQFTQMEKLDHARLLVHHLD